MDDILKSIKAFLYERSVSPLFGAFTLAWSICNYRVLLIALSDSKFSEKLAALNTYFSSIEVTLLEISFNLSGGLVHGVIFPSIVAALYIFAYPWLAAPVYEYSLKKQKEIREIKQAAEGERLLSISESRELFKQLSKLQENYDSERESYDKHIRTLTETISELESNNKDIDTGEVTNLRLNLEKEKDKLSHLEKSLHEKEGVIKTISSNADEKQEELDKLKKQNKDLINSSNKVKKTKKEFIDPDLASDEIEQLMFVGDLGRDTHADKTITESPFKEIVAKKLMQRLKSKGYVHYFDDEHGNQNSIVVVSEGGVSKLLSFDDYAKRKKSSKNEDDIPF